MPEEDFDYWSATYRLLGIALVVIAALLTIGLAGGDVGSIGLILMAVAVISMVIYFQFRPPGGEEEE